MNFRRFTSILILVSFLLSYSQTPSVSARGLFQADDPAASAAQMLARMTPEERVGQLFLVTFNGSTADQDSQIHDLIASYHVGGVVLLASNDNFTAAPDTIPAAYRLISQLQSAEWDASQPIPVGPDSGTPAPTATPTPALANYIPLFISQRPDIQRPDPVA
jgi:beta-N-acetylhexosaminidase